MLQLLSKKSGRRLGNDRRFLNMADALRENRESSVPKARSGILEIERVKFRADTYHDLRGVGQVEIALLTRIDRDHTVGRPHFHAICRNGENAPS